MTRFDQAESEAMSCGLSLQRGVARTTWLFIDPRDGKTLLEWDDSKQVAYYDGTAVVLEWQSALDVAARLKARRPDLVEVADGEE